MVSEAPNDPAKREREGKSNHPENVSLTMSRQGVLPRQRHLLPQQLSRKCMEENSLKLQWQRTNFLDASTCADPGFAGTRAPLSKTSLKHFGQTVTLPGIVNF